MRASLLIVVGWILLGNSTLVGQQTATVTGTVEASSDGRALEGVVITVERVDGQRITTRLVVTTGADGVFTLSAIPLGVRVDVKARSLGFASQTISLQFNAGVNPPITFSLERSVISLDEIVVTGAGAEMERRQLGNTIGTIQMSRLEHAPVTSFSDIIQAREPSVVGLSPAVTGDGARLRIRGTNSLSMSNEPVVYVDGTRVDYLGAGLLNYGGGATGSRLDDINPEAIERIEILKGPAAATLYGSEASSGVIQIFTKSGRSGPTRFRFGIDQGLISYPDAFKPNAGFARSDEQAAVMSELYGVPIVPFQIVERPFANDLLETGRLQTYTAEVSGGSDVVTFNINTRWNRENGPLGAEELGNLRDTIRRLQSNAKIQIIASDQLTIDLTAGFADIHHRLPENNLNLSSPLTAAMAGKLENASCAQGVEIGSPSPNGTPSCLGPGNPMGNRIFTPREGAQWDSFQNTDHFLGNVRVSYALPRIVELTTTFGADVINDDAATQLPFPWLLDHPPGTQSPGRRIVVTRRHREFTFDIRGRRWDALNNRLSSELVIGTQGFASSNSSVRGSNQISAPGIGVVGGDVGESTVETRLEQVNLGLLAQEQLGLDDALFVTMGLRWDRNSAFGANTEGALYPKFGFSFEPRQLPGPLGFLSSVRLRGAYGMSGLQPGAFDQFTTYTVETLDGRGALVTQQVGNPNLAPENSREYEIGGEVATWSERLAFEVTYWNRVTHDALVPQTFPAAGGFLGSQLTNLGRLDASGWELKLNGAILDHNRLSVNIWANAAFLRENVADMGGVAPIKVSGSYQRHRNSLVEGYAPGTYFGARLIPICGAGIARRCFTPGVTVPFDTNGDGVPDTEAAFRAYLTGQTAVALGTVGPMAPLVDDEDGDGDVLDHALGKPTPDWQGSFGVDALVWNSLSISTLFEYRAGDYSVANLTDAFRRSHPNIGRNIRRAAEAEATLLDPSTQLDADARFEAAMRWATELASLSPLSGLNLLEPADFLRWRELTVSYQFPRSLVEKLGFTNVSIAISGRNLHLWTGYTGVDPESNQSARCHARQTGVDCNFLEGNEAFSAPPPRLFQFSVRFGW